MLIIGLTGSSGSGKGYISALFEKAGIPSLDTDEVCRLVYCQGEPCYQTLVETFGNAICREDGQIDRSALFRVTFSDDEQYRKLNDIAFYHIRKKTEDWIDRKKGEGCLMAVIDAPMLFESGFDNLCDVTVAVIADRDTQIKRILSRDGISDSQAAERLNRQKDSDYYRERCDEYIDNSLSPRVPLDQQMSALIARLKKRAGEKN